MKTIYPPTHAKPKGHYSPAVVHNGFVFVSGQLSMDDDGNPQPGTIEEQTKRCLERIKTILIAAGSDVNKVIKVNIFVADIADWPKVNETFARFFDEHRPARIVVPSGKLNYGCLVEIDCVAAV
jgi:2-iminobutanoate/2-iminopropanoate deaminase